jgi:hypothetical protein
MKRMFAAIAFVLPLGLSPLSAADPTVKEIDVTVELDAVENRAAAKYWGTLEVDLEAAILAHITSRIAEDGANLIIDVEEVELSNGFTDATGMADTRLVANVKQTHDTDNSRFEAYDITVDVGQVLPLMPEGTDVTRITADTREFYDAMVRAFAAAVVKRIK